MNLTHVHEFLVLADDLSYSKAAKHLGITKDTLSRHIVGLEEEIGSPLFYRTTRLVTLSPMGTVFLHYARQMVGTWKEFTKEATRQIENRLTIGSFRTMVPHGITDLISRFSRENPDVLIQVVEAHPRRLIRSMQRDECDIAFIANLLAPQKESAYDLQDFTVHDFSEDYFVVLLPSKHPLAKKSCLTMDQMKSENFVTLPSALASDRDSGRHFANTLDNIGAWVAMGRGIAIMGRKEAEEQIFNITGLCLVDFSPRTTLKIQLIHRSRPLSNAALRFRDFTLKNSGGLKVPAGTL